MATSKIVIQTSDGEIVFTKNSPHSDPLITLRKFEHVEKGRFPDTLPNGEPHPHAGRPILEWICVEETPHRLREGSTREMLKALQYYV